jgi:SP family myo-inositol transporter-like MFS transporter 13
MASIGYQLIPKNSSGLIVAHTGSPGTGAILVVISIVIFVSSYALGLGNVPWQSTEFFPMEVRSLATTIVTSFNWGPNIIISSTYLTIMRLITPSGTFGLYAIICFIGWVGVIKYFPECAGLALEEIKEVFMGPESAVKNAQAIRERKRKSLE